MARNGVQSSAAACSHLVIIPESTRPLGAPERQGGRNPGGVHETEVPADPEEGGRQGGLSSHSSAWRLRVLPCFLSRGASVNPQGQAWFVPRPS